MIQELGPELGMDLNLKKNELVKFTEGPDSFPDEFRRFHRNFELLGSPIGDESFCSSYISDFVEKRVNHSLSALRKVEDPQVFHSLVRLTSSFCKVVHLLRTVPPTFVGRLYGSLMKVSVPPFHVALGSYLRIVHGCKPVCPFLLEVSAFVVQLGTLPEPISHQSLVLHGWTSGRLQTRLGGQTRYRTFSKGETLILLSSKARRGRRTFLWRLTRLHSQGFLKVPQNTIKPGY